MTHIALAALIAALLADLLVPVILGFRYPGYSHLIDTISTLGTRESPVRTRENVNLITLGILLLVFAIGQGQTFGSIQWYTLLYLIGIAGFALGCILAGIFPAASKKGEEDLSHKVHGISSGLGFMLLMSNPLWAIFIEALDEYRILNTLFLIAGIITFGLFVISERKETGPLKYTGLYQRLNLVVLYGCLLWNFIHMTQI